MSTQDSNLSSKTATVTRSFVHGLTWTGAMKLVGQSAAWCSTLIVARLLSPNDYGIVGMAAVFLGLLQAVSEFGIGASIVARSDLSASLLPELNSASVVLGFIGTLSGVLLSSAVGSFYDNSALPPVLAAMSTTFLITSFRSVPWALLQRDLRFKRLAIYDAFQSVVLAIGSIVFAILGFRYWTLVAAAITSAIISTTVAVLMHPVPFAFPHWSRVRQVVAFSGNVVTQRLAWYGYSNSDFIVAGRILGSTSLGAYSLAYELAHTPSNKIGGLLFQLSPATLAALRDDPVALRKFIVRISEMIMLIVAPMCVGLAAVAPIFVPLVLGAQWVEMVGPLQVLALYASITILLVVPNQTLLVIGQEKFGTRYSVAQLAVMPLAFFIGSRWGIKGIALAWPIVHPFLALVLLRRVFGAIGLRAVEFTKEAVWPALMACSVMWLGVVGARNLLQEKLGGILLLTILVSLGILIYVSVLGIAHRDRLLRIKSAVQNLRTSRAPQSQPSTTAVSQ